MDIVQYEDRYYDSLIIFLKNNWSCAHKIYDKAIFDWQYKGPLNKNPCAYIVLHKNHIKGFLGGIPYPFILRGKIISGVGFAIWIVDKTMIKSGIGILLRQEMEKIYDFSYSIGINLNVVNTYIKSDYNYFNNLNRYVIMLNTSFYKYFLLSKINNCNIHNWNYYIPKMKIIEPCNKIDSNYLEKIYINNFIPYYKLLPFKQNEFWDWRYINNIGYKYYFFTSPGGTVIVRTEKVYAPLNKNIHGKNCLRIIEILPLNPYIWEDKEDLSLIELLGGALAWSRENDYVLADFQVTNTKFEKSLLKIGFKKQGYSDEANIVQLFSPYKTDAFPLNYSFRINNKNIYENLNNEDIYLVKSDGDMDRPNILS
jgi:hypothetical protein